MSGKLNVLEIGLKEGVEIAGLVIIYLLLPMFLSPTGTPGFRTLCSGFKGSNDILLSLASVIDISMALLNWASSSCALAGFYIIEGIQSGIGKICFED